MYNSFFQLARDPFPASPTLSNYFATEHTENIRSTVIRSVRRGEGPSLIVGSTGIGKSILCQMIAADLKNEFYTVSLNCGRIDSRRTLLQAILFELDQPFRGLEEGELRLSLVDFLNKVEDDKSILLIVDEADSLPLRLLDELRLLTNIVKDGKPLINLVLAGGLNLEERFATPRLESFNQRIAKRCYLETFHREEAMHYVQFQLETAGQDQPIFDEAALVTIYQTTGGIPRLINQLCDHTLLMASVGGHTQISAAGISEAWADLQQLPGPSSQVSVDNAEAPESSSDMLEFGALDEESTESSVPFNAVRTDSGSADQNDKKQEPEYRLKIAIPSEDYLPREEEPEMEVMFESANLPFQETFEEVEVVLDRYASLDDGRLAANQRVKSIEGAVMAELLQSNSVTLNQPEPQIFRTEQTIDVVMPSFDPELNSTDNEFTPLDNSFSSITVEQQPVLSENRQDDRDLLIIDEADAEPEPVSKTLVKPVKARKQEFRQLFTNLRREQA